MKATMVILEKRKKNGCNVLRELIAPPLPVLGKSRRGGGGGAFFQTPSGDSLLRFIIDVGKRSWEGNVMQKKKCVL